MKVSPSAFLFNAMAEIIYPTPEKIIEINKLVLVRIKVKKADKPDLLSYSALNEVIKNCKSEKGDIYDKAVCLLKGITQKHPFASGNRRTAFVVTEDFLIENKAQAKFKNNQKDAKIFKGVREGYYSDEELRNWIKKGEIREFKR